MTPAKGRRPSRFILFDLAQLLLIVLVVAGVGPIHHRIHLEAEEHSQAHDPQTCPQCQSITSLGTEEPQSIDHGGCLTLELGDFESFIQTLHLKNFAFHLPQNRSPPVR